jgi:hypothetical protein
MQNYSNELNLKFSNPNISSNPMDRRVPIMESLLMAARDFLRF